MATRRKVAVCYQSFAEILMDALQYVDTSLPIWHHGDFDFFFLSSDHSRYRSQLSNVAQK